MSRLKGTGAYIILSAAILVAVFAFVLTAAKTGADIFKGPDAAVIQHIRYDDGAVALDVTDGVDHGEAMGLVKNLRLRRTFAKGPYQMARTPWELYIYAGGDIADRWYVMLGADSFVYSPDGKKYAIEDPEDLLALLEPARRGGGAVTPPGA
jgi:hypothetical protein